jgi:RecA-family ATPase
MLMTEDYETMTDEFGTPILVTRERPRVLDPLLNVERPTFRTLNLDDLEQLPEPEWLINGILPATSMTTLFGAPGSAKSFWALDAALSIATGHPFHGSETKNGKVVYSLGEGIRGLKYRIEAWCLAHPTADREAIRENLVIIPKAVHLLEQHEASALINTIDSIGEVSLLIIDTFARALVGGDENSAGDVGLAVAVCDRVRDLSGAATLIVHHTSAEGTKARGSTALPGASDAMLRMTKDDIQHVITVTCTKMKDGEPFKPLMYSLESYGHSAALLPKATTYGTEKFRGRSEGGYSGNPF